MCKKRIKSVRIAPGCISCGTCEAVCPKVFVVKGLSEVLPNPDLVGNDELIRESADLCPVSVIIVEDDETI